MNSSNSTANPQKHAVITFEALEEESPIRNGKEMSLNHRRYPSGTSIELQRQQRRRMMFHLLGWFMVVVMIALAGLFVYYFIGKR